MGQWLTDLRKKPKHVRDNIAFGVSAGVTALLALVWFVGGSWTLGVPGNHAFFQTFLGQFKEQVAAIGEATPVATSTTPSVAPASSTPVESASIVLATTSSTSSASTTPREVRILPIATATASVATTSNW